MLPIRSLRAFLLVNFGVILEESEGIVSSKMKNLPTSFWYIQTMTDRLMLGELLTNPETVVLFNKIRTTKIDGEMRRE
jgi:hypothetical protein